MTGRVHLIPSTGPTRQAIILPEWDPIRLSEWAGENGFITGPEHLQTRAIERVKSGRDEGVYIVDLVPSIIIFPTLWPRGLCEAWLEDHSLPNPGPTSSRGNVYLLHTPGEHQAVILEGRVAIVLGE